MALAPLHGIDAPAELHSFIQGKHNDNNEETYTVMSLDSTKELLCSCFPWSLNAMVAISTAAVDAIASTEIDDGAGTSQRKTMVL